MKVFLFFFSFFFKLNGTTFRSMWNMGHQGPYVWALFDPENTQICKNSGFRLLCKNVSIEFTGNGKAHWKSVDYPPLESLNQGPDPVNNTLDANLVLTEPAEAVPPDNLARHLFFSTYCSTLTHWGWDKMAAIFHTTFSNACSRMKMYKFWFHWSLFPRIQLTVFQHWLR